MWRRKSLEGYTPKDYQLSLGHGIIVDIYHVKICTYPEENNFLKCLHLYYLYNKKSKV